MLTDEELETLKRFMKAVGEPDEIGDRTYVKTGLKKGDTIVLTIMTDAPDMLISTLTGSEASQAYHEARKQEANDRRKRGDVMANPSRPADCQLSDGVLALEHRIWQAEANRRDDQRKLKVLQEDLIFCREKRQELESLIAELKVNNP